MPRWALAAALAAFLSFQYAVWPGHTYLQADTQIYVPVIEWLADPSLFPHDQIPRGAHVSLTLYDDLTRLLAPLTGGIENALTLQQLVSRAAGVSGIYLMARAAQLPPAAAGTVAVVSSLGAWVLGPAVLTVEYEPVPRGFALGLLLLALGLLAHGATQAAGWIASLATLYHAPAVWPFWLAALLLRERWRLLWPLLPSLALLASLAVPQAAIAEPQRLFAILTPEHAAIQQIRAPYAWVSRWWTQHLGYHLLALALVFAADLRLRDRLPARLRLVWLVMAVVGVATMPVSYLLLEQLRWALLPQLQPMRALLFTVQGAILFTAMAAFTRQSWTGRLLWLGVATAFTFAGPGQAPPRLETAELRELSAWAEASTPREATFFFLDEGRGLIPGIFRARARRSVYTDWKAGGQVNYFPSYAAEWWRRWNAVARPVQEAADVAAFCDLGIHYLVARRPIPGLVPVWRNGAFQVFATGAILESRPPASGCAEPPARLVAPRAARSARAR